MGGIGRRIRGWVGWQKYWKKKPARLASAVKYSMLCTQVKMGEDTYVRDVQSVKATFLRDFILLPDASRCSHGNLSCPGYFVTQFKP